MSRRRSSFDSLFSAIDSDGDDADVELDKSDSEAYPDFERHVDAPTAFDEVVAGAARDCPPIPGLWVFPSLLPNELATDTLRGIGESDIFIGGTRDQAMFFDRPSPTIPSPSAFLQLPSNSSTTPTLLPEYIPIMISSVSEILRPLLPAKVWSTLFTQALGRQVIINLYNPGEGISPHVDLPNRYADGIVGVSLVGGCVMEFTPSSELQDERKRTVYIPPRTIYVLSGEARWKWAHGIPSRMEDVVKNDQGEEETLMRDTRVSVTFRWMKEGADILS